MDGAPVFKQGSVSIRVMSLAVVVDEAGVLVGVVLAFADDSGGCVDETIVFDESGVVDDSREVGVSPVVADDSGGCVDETIVFDDSGAIDKVSDGTLFVDSGVIVDCVTVVEGAGLLVSGVLVVVLSVVIDNDMRQ